MSEQTYTIEEIRDTRHWEGKYGPMISYDLSLKGLDAKVELAQKPSTAAPTVGQELVGSIEDGKYGKKFKKAQQQQSFSGQSFKADPAKDARITRQHSQDMGIETLKLAHALGVKLDADSVQTIVAMVKTLADAYDADAYKAGEQAEALKPPSTDGW